MKELTDEELLFASEEDWAFYNKCIEGLPTREGFKGNFLDKDNVEIPYGSGPHILKHFRETIEIVKPTAILEIGFNIGHGAAMLLKLSDAWVSSVDISDKWETKYAEYYLRYKYECFSCLKRKTFDVVNYTDEFDLCFVDGGHEEEDVTADIELCKQLKIPYLLFDDIYPRFGPGVLPAISKFPELELVKDMNNLRLYKIDYDK